MVCLGSRFECGREGVCGTGVGVSSGLGATGCFLGGSGGRGTGVGPDNLREWKTRLGGATMES